MKWGLVGAGSHAARNLVPGLAAAKDNELAGVVASTREKAQAFAADHPGCRAYGCYEEMLADREVDAVFITTPNDLHCPQTLAAAGAGKQVLVEKPMALDETECQSMIDACAAASVALGVGFHMRHHPVHIALRRMIADGGLGELVLLHAEWNTRYQAWTNWRADKRRAGSDVLAAVGVHVLDLMGHLAGAPVREVAPVVIRTADTGMDATIAVSLSYENEVAGLASMTRLSRSLENGVWVFGTKGIAGGPNSLGMRPDGRMVVTINGERTETELGMPNLFAAQFDAFSGAVARGEEPSAGGADGLASVRLARHILAPSD